MDRKIPDIVKCNNFTSSNTSETTQLFTNFFSSVYVTDSTNPYQIIIEIVHTINLNINTWIIDKSEINDFLIIY